MTAFRLGDHVQQTLPPRFRGKLVGQQGTVAAVIRDDTHRREICPAAQLVFDGDPPLNPATGRPTVLDACPQMLWPRQPSLRDYRLRIDEGDEQNWRILINNQLRAAGDGTTAWWYPGILPAHRAWLEALVTVYAAVPGTHCVADHDIAAAAVLGID